MGSLSSAGGHINQTDKVVRHTGDSIDISTMSNDTKIAAKSILSQADKLKQLETTMLSLQSRIAWFDSDYSNSIVLDGDRVSSWAEKTSNQRLGIDTNTMFEQSIQGDPATIVNAPKLVQDRLANGVVRNALYFDKQGVNMVLYGGASALMFEQGKAFTIVCSFKLDESNIMQNGDFVDIVNCWNGDDEFSRFYFYLNDDTLNGDIRFEVYSDNNYSNGAQISAGLKFQPSKPYVVTIAFNPKPQADLDKLSFRYQGNEPRNYYGFGSGISVWPTNEVYMSIGKHSGSNLAGYRSFIGHFYDMLIFDETLSNSDKVLAEEYLAIKCGASQYMSSITAGR